MIYFIRFTYNQRLLVPLLVRNVKYFWIQTKDGIQHANLFTLDEFKNHLHLNQIFVFLVKIRCNLVHHTEVLIITGGSVHLSLLSNIYYMSSSSCIFFCLIIIFIYCTHAAIHDLLLIYDLYRKMDISSYWLCFI